MRNNINNQIRLPSNKFPRELGRVLEGMIRAHSFVAQNRGAISYVYEESYLAVQGEEIVDSSKNEFELIARSIPGKGNSPSLPVIYTTVEKSLDWMKQGRGAFQ